MKPITKAVTVALIQVLLVCSLGAKLLYDRRTRPQAWFRAQRYDPNLPIRGRYLNLQIEVNDPRSAEEVNNNFSRELKMLEQQRSQYGMRNTYDFGRECGSIEVHNGVPVAVFDQRVVVEGSQGWNCDNLSFTRHRTGNDDVLRLNESIIFFISDTAQDPSRLSPGEEMWVLSTIPRKGPPRPISLGIKKAGDTAITPLDLH